jgi:hypothetical protein
LTAFGRCPGTAVRARTDPLDAFRGPANDGCTDGPLFSSWWAGDECVVALAATTVAIAALTRTAATMIPRLLNILMYRRAGVSPRPSSRPVVIERVPSPCPPPVSRV